MAQLTSVSKLNDLLVKQNQLLDKRDRLLAKRQQLLAAPVVKLNQLNRTLDAINKIGPAINKLGPAILKQATIVNTQAAKQFTMGMNQMANVAAVAGASIAATMIRTQGHFSPGAVLRYQYRLGDLSAVVGSVLSPAFERFSSGVFQTSKLLHNLNPQTKSLISGFATAGTVIGAVGVGMWAMSRAGGAVKSMLQSIKAANLARIAAGGAGGMLPGAAGMFLPSMAQMQGVGAAGLGLASAAAGNNPYKALAASVAASPIGSMIGKQIGGGLVKMGAGKIIGGAAARAIPLVGWGLLIDDLADMIWGKSIQGSIMGTNTGKSILDPTRGKDPTNMDAQREVHSFSSVMDAGRRFRQLSAMHTAGPDPDAISAAEFNKNWVEGGAHAAHVRQFTKDFFAGSKTPAQTIRGDVQKGGMFDVAGYLSDILVLLRSYEPRAWRSDWTSPKGSAP